MTGLVVDRTSHWVGGWMDPWMDARMDLPTVLPSIEVLLILFRQFHRTTPLVKLLEGPLSNDIFDLGFISDETALHSRIDGWMNKRVRGRLIRERDTLVSSVVRCTCKS